MGRIRTVKPELFKHEDLFDLEQETGLPIRIAFIGLFTVCDREGRFKWKPRTLKTDVLPLDDLDFSRVLDALLTRGFIQKYACNGGEYGVIPTWSMHQVINNRESASEIPAPTENSYISSTSTRESRVSNASSTPLVHAQVEGKGREGKGREGADDDTTSASASSSVPDGFDDGGFAVPKESPLPMREQPPVSEDPAVVLSVKLRRLGVNVMSTNPHLMQWVADGMSFDLMAEAVAVARENKPEPEKIAPGYLVPILQKLRNPDPVKPAQTRAAPVNEKFNFNHLDRSGDQRAMDEGMQRRGIILPDNDEEIEI